MSDFDMEYEREIAELKRKLNARRAKINTLQEQLTVANQQVAQANAEKEFWEESYGKCFKELTEARYIMSNLVSEYETVAAQANNQNAVMRQLRKMNHNLDLLAAETGYGS